MPLPIMRPGKWFGLTLLIGLLLGMHERGFASCEHAAKLQSMAKNAFLAARGAPQEDDPERYESSYRMPGTYECHVYAAKEGDMASLTCTWRLVRGITEEAAAKNQFDQTVAAFEACLWKAHRRKRYSGKGAVAEFEPKLLTGGSLPMQSLELSYAFYAPWWELELEYQVTKE